MARITIDWRDGWLCIRHTDAHYLEPKETTLWWPVEPARQDEVAHLVGLEARDCRDGTFGYREADRWVYLPLRHGRQTQAIHAETVDVPCPRVRKGTRTRWERGYWEKYLKTQGWVAA
jgi:hypothetical protein